MADDSTLVTRLPHLWIGYALALLFFLTEIIGLALTEQPELILTLIFLGGWGYWLFCVYKYHDVMSSIQGYEHSITAGRAVAMHWIPFYNVYWVFKWPKEIATFVNWRMQSPNAMNGLLVGILVLAGFLLRFWDGAVALAVLFSSATYISRKIRKAYLAPAVPKELHASAATGPLGL